jgi:hypothetical protein
MPRKSLAILALCATLWSVFSPIAPFVKVRDHFTYAETVTEISAPALVQSVKNLKEGF